MATLDSSTFDTLFPLWQADLLATGVLNLASIDFVRPDGMILLVLGVIHLLRDLPYIVIRIPIEHHVRSYLARAGFFAALPDEVIVTPELTRNETFKPIRFNGNCASLLELSLAKTSEELPALIDKIVDATEHLLKYSNQAACDIGILVSEVWQNATQHSSGSISAGVMQVYGDGTQRRLVLAIGDDGIGIANSLRENEQYKNIINDSDAIKMAVKPKVSRLTDETRGNGLHRVVNRTTRNDGVVCIRSGTARYRYQGERHAHWNHHVPHLPGTQVVISLAAA